MNKSMAKMLFAGVVAAAIIADGYFTLIKNNQKPAPASDQFSASESDANSAPNNDAAPATGGNDPAGTPVNPAAAYQDGIYTGASVPTEWGDVQLRVTITAGQLTQIDALQYPATNSNSTRINDQVIPRYTDEALQTQSSDLHLISGATETYQGFTGSLQDALNQALAAPGSYQ